MNSIYSLQNGTDVRGVALENNEKKVTLSLLEVKEIVGSFAIWLKEKSNSSKIRISLGMDSRVTGEKFRTEAVNLLSNMGVEVNDCNMSTTPAMFMSTVFDDYKCHGAIMFTASHMPYIYNGIKMFTREGGLEKKDLTEILDIVDSKRKNNDFIYGRVNIKGEILPNNENIIKKDLISDYSNFLVNRIREGVNSSKNYDKPLDGMKIIVDAGNGAGGFFASKVLEKLGCDIKGSQFLNPDGMFPNHIPNPENKEAMESISQATVKENADLGIIFDTDVDRSALVDNKGNFINKNALIALISKILLEEYPKSTIVTDSVTSNGLNEFINNIGGIHHRFKRGYKNVINEAKRLNSENIVSPLAIETSGHAALKENYFLDDGAYLIAKILIKVAKLKELNMTITDEIKDLHQAKEEFEKRIVIEEEDFKAYASNKINEIESSLDEINGWEKEKVNYEGIRVNCLEEKGWFLLRSSLHEPLLVLNIESDIDGGCEIIYNKLLKLL